MSQHPEVGPTAGQTEKEIGKLNNASVLSTRHVAITHPETLRLTLCSAQIWQSRRNLRAHRLLHVRMKST